MSFLITIPEMVAAATDDVARIGSALTTANAAAVRPTTGISAAAADKVSTAVAELFSGHAGRFRR
ncbi:PE-PGRS family protein PE_PGRS33 [Mycobacterium persicum]|uniref:PE-PGRS family protein PE_PGRS33 n=1 Tax=Mycobacterium persicum TaxID=1487726 RepID=A0AB38V0D1_9MYCO|nr:PE family protein [Mycobacterium persicum]VAZ86173.1 PE-PGRS family protein PE_PGRS33 [Mycobacterium persicum]